MAASRADAFKLLVSLSLIVSSGIALSGCNDAKGNQAPIQDRAVLVAPIHFAPETENRSFAATIKPRVESDQSFRVAGKVAIRLVDVGQQVHAGQPLARLDDTDLKLQVDQAEAELAAARTAFQQSSADENRGEALRGQGWTSQAVYDKQRAATGEARGRQRRAERALELATNALGYSTLLADADGAVTATSIEPGLVVAAGQPAIRIARKGEKEAYVALPETYALQARNGAATLSLWSANGKIYKAKLRELSPVADPATRTFAARYSLPDADDAIALGMSATLTISQAGDAVVARVPLQALFDQGKGPSLWTVTADNGLVLKPVSVIRYDGRDAIVSGGVTEGERIVVLGVQKLDAGQKVRALSQLSF